MSGSELTDEQARGLAARWACTKDSGGRVSKAPELKAREGHEHAADVRRRARLGLRAALEGPLDADELGVLLGWVAREMAREVKVRRVLREAKLLEGQGCGFIARGELESVARLLSSKGLLRPCWLGTWEDGEESELGFVLTRTGAARVVDIDPHDTDTDNDREAIAHHIAYALWGGEGDASGVWTFALDGGESGLAWTLCEAAGWPS